MPNDKYFEINDYFEQIIIGFQGEKKLFDFKVITEFQLQEFFIVKCKQLLYFVLVGNIILIDSWNTEIQNFLKMYIKENVDSDTKSNLTLEDLTYFAKDKKIKPRRLRSVKGALRRILEDIKIVYCQEDTVLTHVKFHAIRGGQRKASG